MRDIDRNATVFGDQINVAGTHNVGKMVNPDSSEQKRSSNTPESSGSTVFVSYSHCDMSEVAELVSKLRGLGLDIWFDRTELRVGQLWRDQIRESITTAAGVIVVFSNRSAQRSWSQQAVEVALARDVRSTRLLPVIPIRLDDCEIPGMPIGPGAITLDDVHAIDLEGRLQVAANEIANQLRHQHKSLACCDNSD